MDGDNARSMEAIDLDDIRRLAALAEADEQALFAERPARAATQADCSAARCAKAPPSIS